MIFNKYLVKYKLFKNDIRSIFLYLFASLIPIIVNLSINPWIAINMSPIDYTIVGYYTSFNLLFTPLITFSFSSYYVKKYFEGEINERKKIKVVVIKYLIYSSFILTTLSLSIIYIYHIYFNYRSSNSVAFGHISRKSFNASRFKAMAFLKYRRAEVILFVL